MNLTGFMYHLVVSDFYLSNRKYMEYGNMEYGNIDLSNPNLKKSDSFKILTNKNYG